MNAIYNAVFSPVGVIVIVLTGGMFLSFFLLGKGDPKSPDQKYDTTRS